MPLGRNIGSNIRELEENGTQPRAQKQIVAIALNAARKAGAHIPQPPKGKAVKLPPAKHWKP